ncbi:hypothetical protein EVAR_13549_1 [Eumeta japonica]|uniref:Uncharacterized protein n=1 Tax=Eumeta variegata TaxID=151549 RepID=A0A4C1U8Z5_EUMVA|nr:hypothetical protein EVAR_13549_1 [Eumeta japonica]
MSSQKVLNASQDLWVPTIIFTMVDCVRSSDIIVVKVRTLHCPGEACLDSCTPISAVNKIKDFKEHFKHSANIKAILFVLSLYHGQFIGIILAGPADVIPPSPALRTLNKRLPFYWRTKDRVARIRSVGDVHRDSDRVCEAKKTYQFQHCYRYAKFKDTYRRIGGPPTETMLKLKVFFSFTYPGGGSRVM